MTGYFVETEASVSILSKQEKEEVHGMFENPKVCEKVLWPDELMGKGWGMKGE